MKGASSAAADAALVNRWGGFSSPARELHVAKSEPRVNNSGFSSNPKWAKGLGELGANEVLSIVLNRERQIATSSPIVGLTLCALRFWLTSPR